MNDNEKRLYDNMHFMIEGMRAGQAVDVLLTLISELIKETTNDNVERVVVFSMTAEKLIELGKEHIK